MSTSIRRREIEHFAKDSPRWWDEDGPFRPLHMMNPLRLNYIRDSVVRHFRLDDGKKEPFGNLKILDIGCGGGLVCEPLARLGADVTGIDADKQAVEVAKSHARGAELVISYREGTAESLTGKKKFDVVLALEIVEHVADVRDFVRSCAVLCKPGGLLIFSTLNRTAKSFLLGIVAAENILRWVPVGTHDWRQFVRPSELASALRDAGLAPGSVNGYTFHPVKGEFVMTDNDCSVNYFMTAERP